MTLGPPGLAETVMTVRSGDGTPIVCGVSGDGPPVLMVHGTGDDRQRFGRLRESLAQRFRLYLMDRRGCGESGDGSGYRLADDIADILAVLRAIGRGVNLFGHSHGAVCAAEAACRTDRVGKLLLYEPPLPSEVSDERHAERVRLMVRDAASGDYEAVIERYLRAVVRVPEPVLAQLKADGEAWRRQLAKAPAIAREVNAIREYRFVPERFAAIRAPVRFLLGSQTAPGLVASTRVFRAALPGSELVELAGQGHVAFATAPELFLAELCAFFAG